MIADLYDHIDPVPPDLVDRLQFSITLDALNAELAELQQLPEAALSSRAEQSSIVKTLTFTSDSLTTMISISPDGPDRIRIDGWIAPGAEASVELHQGALTRQVSADADGRFVFEDVAHGLTRFVVRPADPAAASAGDDACRRDLISEPRPLLKHPDEDDGSPRRLMTWAWRPAAPGTEPEPSGRGAEQARRPASRPLQRGPAAWPATGPSHRLRRRPAAGSLGQARRRGTACPQPGRLGVQPAAGLRRGRRQACCTWPGRPAWRSSRCGCWPPGCGWSRPPTGRPPHRTPGTCCRTTGPSSARQARPPTRSAWTTCSPPPTACMPRRASRFSRTWRGVPYMGGGSVGGAPYMGGGVWTGCPTWAAAASGSARSTACPGTAAELR